MASPSELLSKWRQNKPLNQKMYQTKKIYFFGNSTRIVLQNENGQCPLIAICNVMLLRGTYNLNDQTLVSEEYLLTPVIARLPSLLEEDEDKNSETVASAVSLMPKLTTGLDVNVKFQRIDGFELTKEYALFGSLDMRLVHGWLVDPRDTETAKAIGSMSYNDLTDELVRYDKNLSSSLEKEDVDPTSANSDGVISEPTSNVVKSSKKMKEATAESSSSASTSDVNEGELIRRFLYNNRGQLTEYGLYCLQEGLEEEKLCVFFHNDHFNTMLKHQGEVYTLVTDEGYMDRPDVVWEKLTEVNGNNEYVNSNFVNVKPVNHEDIPETSSKSVKKKDAPVKPVNHEDKPESSSKSVKKKDAPTVLRDFLTRIKDFTGSWPGVDWEKLIEGTGDTDFVHSYLADFKLPESSLKSVKKKDTETVLKEFEDFLAELAETPDLDPIVQQALELLGIDENELLHRSETSEETRKAENTSPSSSETIQTQGGSGSHSRRKQND